MPDSRRFAFGRLALASLSIVAGLALATPAPPAAQDTLAPNVTGCLACHVGIEDMHPEASLSCTDCHGGNAAARQKSEAHVSPSRADPPDERVVPIDEDLAYRRFVDPMDLRVAKETCGKCHADLVEHLKLSLHGTTAGHLSDGYYEMGVLEQKVSAFSVFPSGPFRQVPAFRGKQESSDLGVHFTDLARKECLQCHLYSEGRAVRGRVGFDGDYRGEGCAACHVEYARDGLSRSRDKSAVRTEPGHAATHSMTRAPKTDACVACHWGDAAIGTNFRGLAALPPGAAGGPDIPGTTKELLNRQYYMNDPAVSPPDVHHERGMHCIDCHTLADVMGDGRSVGKMEHAVEISCSDCHGTLSERSTLRTERGSRIPNLRREGDRVVLTSNVTGEEHPVTQIVDVIDPASPKYNALAAQAMTGAHGKIECYACHASWNPNLLGFHFDRNESLTQLDLLTGRRTPGRVTTQEKVFSTWKGFYAGLNERGFVAPYMTGFSTMGSVSNESGERILDQVMPVTAAGLSGMTMIHHQMHTTRKTARSCIECHRTSTTWGLGSSNFRLARQLAFVADRRGIEVIAVNRSQPSTSTPLAKLVLPDVTALAIRSDPLQGHATEVFACEGARGVHVVDVTTPTAPRTVAFTATSEPHDVKWSGDWLYVADGPGGLRIYDVSEPKSIRLAGRIATVDARAVNVQWPWAYVADGAGGLVIVDVSAPIAPRIVGGALFTREDGSPGEFTAVETLFQYSRPRSRKDKDGVERVLDERTTARNLCALLDEDRGLFLVDVTEPTEPRLLYPAAQSRQRSRGGLGAGPWRGMALASHVDLAQAQGGARTAERDYVYLLSERAGPNPISTVAVVDVTDPARPRRMGQSIAGQSTESLALASFYNPPFLQTLVFACGQDGVFATDVSISSQPSQLGTLAGMRESYVIAVESFPLDRMIDERSRRLKDVSHADSRWLYAAEVARILGVASERLGKTDATTRVPWPLAAAYAAFERIDVDRSGALTGKELATAPPAIDANDDQRGTFAEFARASAALPPSASITQVLEAPRIRATRTDPDGDLARLFDRIDPRQFDKDQDSRLSRAETDGALFAALDLDGDRALSKSEASRVPGPLRKLRFDDAQAEKVFASLDTDGSGTLVATEVRVRDEDWRALDANEDGFVQLAVERRSKAAKSGKPALPPEWPSRRAVVAPLAPDATLDRLLAKYDKNGDRNLSRGELEARPDFLIEMDDNGDDLLGYEELKVRCDFLFQAGVDVVHDGFAARWDSNRDGQVSADELPVAPYLRTRLGL